GVRRGDAREEGDDGRRDGDEEGVPEPPDEERIAHEVAPVVETTLDQGRAVEVEGPALLCDGRHARNGNVWIHLPVIGLAGGLDGRDEHPVEGKQREDDEEEQGEMKGHGSPDEPLADWPPHRPYR